MLFNLQNLPFLGHIRSVVEFFRCGAVLRYFQNALSPLLPSTVDPATNIGFEAYGPSAIPKNSFSFVVDGTIDSSGMIDLFWVFANDYDINLETTIDHFQVDFMYFDSSTTSNLIFEPLDGVKNIGASYITYRGEGNYSIRFPLVTRPLTPPLPTGPTYNVVNMFRVRAYSKDKECTLLESNECYVFKTYPIPVQPVNPQPPTNKQPIPIPGPQIPVDCQNYSWRMAENPDVRRITSATLSTRVVAKTPGYANLNYQTILDINVTLNSPASNRYPKVHLLCSTDGPLGPFNKLLRSTETPGGPNSGAIFFSQLFNGKVSIPDIDKMFPGKNVCFRLIASQSDTPGGCNYGCFCYDVLCLGCISFPAGTNCANNTLIPLPNLTVGKRELIAGVYGDPCGIYQYMEISLPTTWDLNASIYRTSVLTDKAYVYDYDGTANPGFWGATSISPVKRHWVTVNNLAITRPSTPPPFSWIDGGSPGWTWGNQGTSAFMKSLVARTYGYRMVNGTYINYPVGFFPVLIKVGSFSDKEATVNAEIGILAAHNHVVTIDANGLAPVGNVFNVANCSIRSEASYVIAIQTANEINDFYRANKANFTSCVVPPPFPRVFPFLPPRPVVRAGTTITQDAHIFVINKNGNQLRGDTLLFIDDNTSSNPINYLYLEKDEGETHVIRYTQRSVRDNFEPDWLDDDSVNTCTVENGYLIDNIFYYTGVSPEALTLVGDAQSLPNPIIIDDKISVSFSAHPVLSFPGPGRRRPLYLDVDYINYASNFNHANGTIVPVYLDSEEYFSDIAKMGGAFYHITKKVGEHPTTELPYFCYGEGKDGINSFVGIPRATFEDGFVEEVPDTEKIFNFIEVMGGGLGPGVEGGDIFDPSLAEPECSQDLCFDPMISKRGMVEIQVNVSSSVGKRFKGIMRGAIHEVTDPENPILITDDIYFLRNGTTASPEDDTSVVYVGKTGIIDSPRRNDELAVICDNCGMTLVSGHEDVGQPNTYDTVLLTRPDNFFFNIGSQGTLRFSAIYDYYGPTLDCLQGDNPPNFIASVAYEEFVNYSVSDIYKDFFCLGEEACTIDKILKSVTDLIVFTGIGTPVESTTISVRVLNTGNNALRPKVARFTERDQLVIGYPVGDEGVASRYEFGNLDDPGNPFTGIAQKKTGEISALFPGYLPNPCAPPYSLSDGSDPNILGPDYLHTFVVEYENLDKLDSVAGRYISVFSDYRGDMQSYWETHLRPWYNSGKGYLDPLGEAIDPLLGEKISDFDRVDFFPLELEPECQVLVSTSIPDSVSLDYRPIEIKAVNASNLPIMAEIDSYLNKSSEGVVKWEAATSQDLGNYGRYYFYNSNDNEEPAPLPYAGGYPNIVRDNNNSNQRNMSARAVVDANSDGTIFLVDPNAHFITVKFSRLHRGVFDVSVPGSDLYEVKTRSPSETFVISRTGVPQDIINFIQSGDIDSRIRVVKNVNLHDFKNGLELVYKETIVPLDTQTLTLQDDEATPGTGELNFIVNQGSLTSYYHNNPAGATAEVLAGYQIWHDGNDAPYWCSYKPFVPAPINIPGILKSSYSIITHTYGSPPEQTYVAQLDYVISGFSSGYNSPFYFQPWYNVNSNPSPSQKITFGNYSGHHFVIKMNDGYLSYDKFEKRNLLNDNGFRGYYHDQYEDLTGRYYLYEEAKFGKYSPIWSPAVTYPAKSDDENTVNFKERSQILATNFGYLFNEGYSRSVTGFLETFWDHPVVGGVTGRPPSALISELSEVKNDYWKSEGAQEGGFGPFRSFNEMDIHLTRDQKRFSGVTLDFTNKVTPWTGDISIAGDGKYSYWYNVFTQYDFLDVGALIPGQQMSQACMSQLGEPAETGVWVQAFVNHRGKDYYVAQHSQVTIETNNVAPGASSAILDDARDQLHAVLVDYYGVDPDNYHELYGVVDTIGFYDTGSHSSYRKRYYTRFLFENERKVRVEGQPSFTLSRVDHSLQLRDVGLDHAPVPIDVDGPPIDLPCEDQAGIFLRDYHLRFVNMSVADGYVLNKVEITPFNGNTPIANYVVPGQYNVRELFGGGFMTNACLSKYHCEVFFTNTADESIVTQEIDINIVNDGVHSYNGQTIQSKTLSPTKASIRFGPHLDTIDVVPI